MSAWIKSYQSLREHPKTHKLARRVGGGHAAVGLLHYLWWWCLDYAPDGDLTGHDAEDIAIGCGWEGKPADLIKHLTACGFLDNGDGLHVHDWWEYGGALVDRRERNKERMREARATHVQRTCNARVQLERKKEEKERKNARGRAKEPLSSDSKEPEPSKFDFLAAAQALREKKAI